MIGNSWRYMAAGCHAARVLGRPLPQLPPPRPARTGVGATRPTSRTTPPPTDTPTKFDRSGPVRWAPSSSESSRSRPSSSWRAAGRCGRSESARSAASGATARLVWCVVHHTLVSATDAGRRRIDRGDAPESRRHVHPMLALANGPGGPAARSPIRASHARDAMGGRKWVRFGRRFGRASSTAAKTRGGGPDRFHGLTCDHEVT